MRAASLLLCGGDRRTRWALAEGLTGTGRRHEPRVLMLDEESDPEAVAEVLLDAAQSAEAAVIIAPADEPTVETRGSARLAAQLGIGQVVVAVDVDRLEAPDAGFRLVEQELERWASTAGLIGLVCVPVSLRGGENLRAPGARLSWYEGPPLLDRLGESLQANRAVDGDSARDARTRARSASGGPVGFATQFEATIVWTGEHPLLRGRTYLMQAGARTVDATIAPLKYKLRAESLEHVPATRLERGEIGVGALELSEPIAFAAHLEDRRLGSFMLRDRVSGRALGVALIHFALRRSLNLHRQAVEIDKHVRAASLEQQPTVLWLTGLSGAGKSTIANLVESELHRRGHHTYLLDGDNVRHGLNADLGFTDADRVENIRRVSEVARLMVDAGLIVLVSFISPFRTERLMARSLFDDGEFVEVFVDTPLSVAEARDTKGLYRKARRGELINFTGIDSPYEVPEHPDLHLRTTELTPQVAAEHVIALLEARGRLRAPVPLA